MKKFGKAIALTVGASILMSGCTLFEKKTNKEVKKLDEDEIIEVTESLCSAIKSGKANKIKKLINDDSDFDTLDELLGGYMMAELCDTIEYEIDEDSIKEKKDTVQITAELTFVDVYEINDNNPYGSTDELNSAIEDGEMASAEYTFVWIDVDGDWLLEDASTVIEIYGVFEDFDPIEAIIDDIPYDHDSMATVPGATPQSTLIENQTAANATMDGLTEDGYTYIVPMCEYAPFIMDGEMYYYLADVCCVKVGDPSIVYSGDGITLTGDYYTNSIFMVYNDELSMQEVMEIYIGENELYSESYGSDYGSVVTFSSDGESIMFWKVDELGYINVPNTYMIQYVKYNMDSLHDQDTVDALTEWADMAAFDTAIVDGL